MIGSLMPSTRYDRVLRLLDRERKVLLDGPLGELAALVERREALVAELVAEERALPAAFLAAVKARAERNGRLIRAAIEGVRAAAAQVAAIDAAEGRLRTYSADGAPVEVARPRITRDTRA
jgi:flagellar biosynthesis/type III secretory pathway chaperone